MHVTAFFAWGMCVLWGLLDVDKLPAMLEAAGFRRFIKDCCYIKLYQDYKLYNNKVLFYKISDSCAALENHYTHIVLLMFLHYFLLPKKRICSLKKKCWSCLKNPEGHLRTLTAVWGYLQIILKTPLNNLDEKIFGLLQDKKNEATAFLDPGGWKSHSWDAFHGAG